MAALICRKKESLFNGKPVAINIKEKKPLVNETKEDR